MSPFVSPYPFLASPFFNFSFSVSRLFFSSRLPSCLFCFLLIPCFSLFLFLSSLHERNNIKNIQLQLFWINRFSFSLVSCLFSSFESLFLIFAFPDYKLCFLFIINAFGFKISKLKKTPIFGQKGGCNKTFFFVMNLCFAKCEKFSFFFCPSFLLHLLVVLPKKHYKIGISAHKSKKTKIPFFKVINWAKSKLLIGPS